MVLLKIINMKDKCDPPDADCDYYYYESSNNY